MGTESSATPRTSMGYLELEVRLAREAVDERGLELDYLPAGVARGEDPPILIGDAVPALGLVAGATMSSEVARQTWTELLHPETGKPLGQRKAHYAGYGERLARQAVMRGIALPDDLQPAAIREGVLTGKRRDARSARKVNAWLRECIAPEELKAMRREAKGPREPVSYWDVTISGSKDASILQAAFEWTGDFDSSRKVDACLMKAAEAELRVLAQYVGSRMGHDGTDKIKGLKLAAAVYFHRVSRAGDPQLHVHMAVLNRALCEDGKWRALDGTALLAAMPMAAAVGQRVFDEEMARTFGLTHHYDPKRKARIIDGITDEMMDLFSERRAAIMAAVGEWAKKFEARNGRAPNLRERDAAAQHYAYETRQPKPTEMEARPDAVRRWQTKMSERRGKTLDDVLAAVRPAEHDTEKKSPKFDRKKVAIEAIQAVAASRDPGWTRLHVGLEVDRHLPSDLAMSEDESRALVESIVAKAMEWEGVSCIAAGEPERPETFRYALTATLEREAWLLSLPLQNDAPRIDPPAAAIRLATTGLRPDQLAAVREIATSGRALDILIGPAGTGKSYAEAELARLWHAETGAPVFGLTPSDTAAKVLRGEGLVDSVNVARWLRMQGRLAAGRPRKGEERFALKPGSLVIIDEASMVSTDDLARASEIARAAGAKLVWAGDDHQLGAVEQAGALRLVSQNRTTQRVGAVHELTYVGRFRSPWEGDASLRARVGDVTVLDTYERHGRIEGGTLEEMSEAAVQGYLADRLAGKDSVLLVPTNELAVELSMRVRAELVELGRVSNERTAILWNRSIAGVGDIVQARKNDRKVTDPATGETLSNRDTFEVVAVAGDGLKVRSSRTGCHFTLPASYVAEHVELAYASTVHAAQGRTVDTAYGIVDDRCSREYLYVMMTRGRETNQAFVITESLDELREPCDVLADVLARSDAVPTATEIRMQEADRVRASREPAATPVPDRRSDAELCALVAKWDRSYAEAPTYVADELDRARQELRRARYDHGRDLAVNNGEANVTSEASRAEVERLEHRVEQLDRRQDARDRWWERSAGLREAAASARAELAARHPEIDRSQLLPPPVPEQYWELDRQRQAEHNYGLEL